MTQHLLSLHRNQARSRFEGQRKRFETKEADPAAMDPEFKRVWDGFMKDWTSFKSANDERFKGVTLKKDIDVLIDEKVNRINESLDKQQKLIDAAVAEFKRAPLSQKDEKGFSLDQRNYIKGFNDYMRKGDKSVPNMYELAEKSFPQYKALMEGSNPDGGWLVSPEVDNAIDRVTRKVITFRGLATVRQIGGPSFQKIVSLGGAGSGWVGETSSRSETTTPTLEVLNFSVGEIYANPKATQTILDDANINIEQWLADEVGIEFAEKENVAFITGDGAVGKPKGVLSYSTTLETGSTVAAWGSIGYVKTGVAADWAATNPADAIKSLITALKTRFRNGANFILHRRTTGTIRKFKDTAGGTYLWQPGLQAGQPSLIDGYPFVEDDDWPEAGANNFMMGFGNWSTAYLILDRIGVRVLRDPFTAKPYVQFYTTKRVGGGVQQFEAYKLLKCEV